MMRKYLSGVIAFEGSHSGGGGTPLSVYLIIEHFSRAKKEYWLFSDTVCGKHEPTNNKYTRKCSEW